MEKTASHRTGRWRPCTEERVDDLRTVASISKKEIVQSKVPIFACCRESPPFGYQHGLHKDHEHALKQRHHHG
ncbi:hypothetical protein E9531_09965 [Lampropedia puyangensis]|uniref:Uncharacterized protein n=1 Tax=Lampropedia puyangensis TaxID=1330072 RepID=A0A4S8F5M5_9BURK|nr:hypothetical protein E9531_09965 [Lampropedia puyangensis]